MGMIVLKKRLRIPFLEFHCSISKRTLPCPATQIQVDVNLDDVYDGILERELYATFDELLNKHDVNFEVGDRVVGTVMSMDKKFVYVKLGLKDYAILPREEVSLIGKRPEDVLLVGQSKEFL